MGIATPPPTSSNTVATRSSSPAAKRSPFIPSVTDMESARAAGKQGAWAAFITAGVTAVVAAIAAASPGATRGLGVDAWAFVDAAMFLGLGIGIWLMSRICAVGALALYLLERVFMAVNTPGNATKGIALTVILVIAYANGIRGTFAFQRFKRSLVPPQIPNGSLSPQ